MTTTDDDDDDDDAIGVDCRSSSTALSMSGNKPSAAPRTSRATRMCTRRVVRSLRVNDSIHVEPTRPTSPVMISEASSALANSIIQLGSPSHPLAVRATSTSTMPCTSALDTMTNAAL